MAQPFVGQVVAVGFNFAPQGWFLCDGALLPIAQFDVLFNLIGTTYGGNGQTTFALPDLRGRAALGTGQGAGLSNHILGQPGGVESVTLTGNQFSSHTHALKAAATATTPTPGSAVVLGTPAAASNALRARAAHYVARPKRGLARRRLRPTARESAAQHDDQLHHRLGGNFSVAELTSRRQRGRSARP